MNFEDIKKYWEDRAATDASAQSTTQDFYLREIEFRTIKELVQKYQPSKIMDVGCGDARTTARLASEFPTAQFFGGDYAESMVRNAKTNIEAAKIKNLTVDSIDVVSKLPHDPWDMIFTTRCLINLPSWELQKLAIKNISDVLVSGGHYIMIENFLEGQENLNNVRQKMGLPDIKIRDHNLFFSHSTLVDYASKYFDVAEDVNISSSYYLISRVIYSKICQDNGTIPDYFDAHHKYSTDLPFVGEYGPVRMLCLKKR